MYAHRFQVLIHNGEAVWLDTDDLTAAVETLQKAHDAEGLTPAWIYDQTEKQRYDLNKAEWHRI